MHVELAERPQLDQSILDQRQTFEGLPLVSRVAVFGRGSKEIPGAEPVPYYEAAEHGESARSTFDESVNSLFEEMTTPRELTEAGKNRVRAVGAYALVHEGALRQRAGELGRPAMRVLFSCGYSNVADAQAPPERYREGRLMMEFAKELGMLDYFEGLIEFGEQVDSSSTIGDAVYAAESSLFAQDDGGLSADRRIGVVSHEPHMKRCIDAMRWAFRLKRQDILAIPAQGEDQNMVGAPEWAVRGLMRFGTVFARRTHERLLAREAWIMDKVHRLQGSRGNSPTPQAAAENV